MCTLYKDHKVIEKIRNIWDDVSEDNIFITEKLTRDGQFKRPVTWTRKLDHAKIAAKQKKLKWNSWEDSRAVPNSIKEQYMGRKFWSRDVITRDELEVYQVFLQQNPRGCMRWKKMIDIQNVPLVQTSRMTKWKLK